MTYFIISPSEAFLIGRCVGEYREARHDNEFADILSFIVKYIQPVVPYFPKVDECEVSRDDVPLDIEWFTGENEEIGYSVTDPPAIYRRQEHRVVRTEYTRSRNSLVDLLLNLLEPFAERSGFMQSMYPRRDDDLRNEAHVPVQYVSEGMEKCAELMFERDGWDHEQLAQAISYWYTPQRPDDENSVARIIEALIADPQNQHSEPYQIGIAFGRAFAAIERLIVSCLKGYFINPWSIDQVRQYYRGGAMTWAPGTFDQYSQTLHALLEHCGTKIPPLAQVTLTHECDLTASRGDLERLSDGSPTHDVAIVLERKAALSFATGCTIGPLSGSDSEAYCRDVRSGSPRIIKLSPHSGPERLRGQVLAIEQMLHPRFGVSYQPEHLVEGLTKELWPEDFSPGAHRSGIRNVLHRHRNAATEAESRFAQIALTLYGVYRNSAEHEPHRFSCSWPEAHFFLAGLRTLLDLSDRIKEERQEQDR